MAWLQRKNISPCGQLDNGFRALPWHRVEDGDVSGGDEYPAAVDEHPGDAEGRLAPTPNVVEDKEASTETLRQKEPKYQSHIYFRLWENCSKSRQKNTKSEAQKTNLQEFLPKHLKVRIFFLQF